VSLMEVLTQYEDFDADVFKHIASEALEGK
jgi:hypothetical protein